LKYKKPLIILSIVIFLFLLKNCGNSYGYTYNTTTGYLPTFEVQHPSTKSIAEIKSYLVYDYDMIYNKENPAYFVIDITHPIIYEQGTRSILTIDYEIGVNKVKVFEDTIKYYLKDKITKEIIPIVKKEKGDSPRDSYIHYVYTYNKRLPDEILEYIYLEYEINGKRKILEYEIPLTKTWLGNFWTSALTG